MSKKDLIVGLDVGTTKISCVVGEVSEANDENHIDIIGIGTSPSHGLKKGVVVNIDSTVESISKAVEEAELMAGVEINSVTVGIAGTHIRSFNSSGIVAIKDGEIQQSDVNRVIDAAKAVAIPLDREVLHVIPQEFVIDGQDGIRDPIGMSGVRLECRVHVVTGSVSSAQNLTKCANRAGLNVSGVCLQSIASSMATLSEDEKDLGVLLVDIGGGTSDIAIYKDGALVHTSVLAIGGNHITNDVAIGLRTPQQEAERIKVEYGCALSSMIESDETIEVPGVGGRKARVVSRKVLTEIIEPRVEEIFSLIHREVMKAGFQEAVAGGVVITGGASLLEGMVEVAENIFDMPLKRGLPNEIGGLIDMANSPKFATGVGLLKFSAQGLHKRRAQMGRDRKGYDKVLGSMRSWFRDLF